MGKRQIEFQLSVTYDTPRKNLENVVQDLRELLVNHPDVHKDTILVSFDQYKENGYGIFIYFFTNTTVWAEFLKVKEEINFEIISILEKQGVQHAIPSRRLSVDNEMELQLKKETVANPGS